jgi:DNA-binding transcriptional MerR regulator
MRELEARSGVGREAIRYYIREGVLPQTHRPRRNVANYSEEHVARLRLIRELKEKRLLPLKAVKAVLDTPDVRELIRESLPGVEHLLPALLDGDTPQPRQPVAQTAEATGLDEITIRDIAAAGIIAIHPGDLVDFRDAELLATWGQARAAGFDAAHGYDAGYLGAWLEALRPATRQTVDHFIAQFGGDEPRAAAELGVTGVGLTNRLLAQLHTRLVLEALAQRTVSAS